MINSGELYNFINLRGLVEQCRVKNDELMQSSPVPAAYVLSRVWKWDSVPQSDAFETPNGNFKTMVSITDWAKYWELGWTHLLRFLLTSSQYKVLIKKTPFSEQSSRCWVATRKPNVRHPTRINYSLSFPLFKNN